MYESETHHVTNSSLRVISDRAAKGIAWLGSLE